MWRRAAEPVFATSSPFPCAALAARLAYELQRLDADPFFGALAHVVNRERGNGARGHRFHLNSCFAFAANDGANLDRAGVRIEIEGDVDGADGQRVGEGNEVRRLLGGE